MPRNDFEWFGEGSGSIDRFDEREIQWSSGCKSVD